MGKKSSNHGKHGDSFFDSSFDRTIASFLEFMFFEHYVAQEEEKIAFCFFAKASFCGD